MTGYGCVIGGEFLGYIMYADDLVLVSHSVCVLQKMIGICVDELNCIGLTFNVKKSCLLRFIGPRYMHVCEPITLYDNRPKLSLHNMYMRQDILELHCVQVNVFVWICVQQNPILF